jgi:proline iminopeptidase
MLIRVGVFVGMVLMASLPAAQEGSFVSSGLELHYGTAGAGTPMVILSGGPGFEVSYMVAATEGLPASIQRVFLEQRGTGRSRPAKLTADNVTLRLMINDLEALREHLKQDRLLLLGHSWGGMLAMAYAAEHPNRVDRLILVDSGGPTMEFFQWFGDNLEARLAPEDREARRYWQEAEKHGVDRDKVFLERSRAGLPGYFFDRAKALEFASHLSEGFIHTDALGLLMGGDLPKSYDVRAGIVKLDRPVLIVQGHQDPVGDKTAEDIHALIQSSTLRYLNKCGHFPWIEQPDEYRKIVNEFLARAQ